MNRNGASRPGALPASADSLKNSLDQISTLRAYGPELTGWFDDFGHSGFPDAFGGIGRISTTLNTFSAGPPSSGVPCNRSSASSAAPAPAAVDPATPSRHRHQVPAALPRLQRARPQQDQLTQGGTVDCNPTRPRWAREAPARHLRPARRSRPPASSRSPARPIPAPIRSSSSTPSAWSRAPSSGSRAPRRAASPISRSHRRRPHWSRSRRTRASPSSRPTRAAPRSRSR